MVSPAPPTPPLADNQRSGELSGSWWVKVAGSLGLLALAGWELFRHPARMAELSARNLTGQALVAVAGVVYLWSYAVIKRATAGP